MLKVTDGQCGRCAHYGEKDASPKLVQIRVKGEAPEDFVAECGHPANADMHLSVAPTSSCDGFKPA